VEEEHQAAAAARLFNAEDVDIIVAMELAYTKGVVPARCLIDTTGRSSSGTPRRSAGSARATGSTS
jgi:hypothetical protein